jgi:hypothetical protein
MDVKTEARLTLIFLFLQINLSAQEKKRKLTGCHLEKFQNNNHHKILGLNIKACD